MQRCRCICLHHQLEVYVGSDALALPSRSRPDSLHLDEQRGFCRISLSNDEAAEIGKPVEYVEAMPDQSRGALKAMGMPDSLVEIILEMYGAYLDGRMDADEPRTPLTTTPTTLAEFARTRLLPAITAAL